MSALEPVDGPDDEGLGDIAERMRLVSQWGALGLCQACGDQRATRLMPAEGQLREVKLCDRCAVGERTVPLPAAPQPVQDTGSLCERCGGPRPDGRLRLCRRCGKDVVRRCVAYQVVSVPGLGAGRAAIDVRVGKN